MIRTKWILASLVSLSLSAPAQSVMSTDDIELEQRIGETLKSNTQSVQKTPIHAVTLFELASFLKKSDSKQKNCVDDKKVTFADKYVLTYDAQGSPCRVYDLSFPNLRALLKTTSFFQVPVRTLTSKDFLNALDNDWESIQRRNAGFGFLFNARTAAKNSFVSTLKFKNKPQAVWGSQTTSTDVGLPKSFTLADLELNANLQLPAQTKADMADLLTQLDADSSLTAEKSNQIRAYFQQVMSKPETMLATVKFNFNDLTKVYDVILDADFLPLMGPVELINFQRQYKGTVEKMFRGLLGGILKQAARFIPNKTVSAVVEVVVEDLFEQIDIMYDYQSNRLEETLKNISSYPTLSAADAGPLGTRALNILYGQKSDLMTTYLMSVVQGTQFDWQAFEKLGQTNRYNIEKQRQIMMDTTNNRLVLEKKCTTEIVNEYFAICTRNGVKDGLYSLISEQSLPFKNMGAPLIHRYKRPYEVPVIRGMTWLLSVGLRVVGLPLNRTITYQLNSYLKNFLRAGILDEAFLQNDLFSNQMKGVANAESQKLLSWLYVQNLNPLMPKSYQFENSIIKANKTLLGIN